MDEPKEIVIWAFKDLPVRIIWLEPDGVRIREEVVVFKEKDSGGGAGGDTGN